MDLNTFKITNTLSYAQSISMIEMADYKPASISDIMKKRLEVANSTPDERNTWLFCKFTSIDAAINTKTGVKIVIDCNIFKQSKFLEKNDFFHLRNFPKTKLITDHQMKNFDGIELTIEQLRKAGWHSLSKEKVKSHPLFRALANDDYLLSEYMDFLFHYKKMRHFDVINAPSYFTTDGVYIENTIFPWNIKSIHNVESHFDALGFDDNVIMAAFKNDHEIASVMPGSAEQYLRRLQLEEATHPIIDYHRGIEGVETLLEGKHDIRSLSDNDKQKLVNAVSNPNEAFQEIIIYLKNIILSAVDAQDRKKIHDIPIGSLYTHSANAWTIESPNGDPVIIIHNGMFGFIHDMSRVIASATDISGHENNTIKYDLDTLAIKTALSCMHFLSDGKILEDYFLLLGEEQGKLSSTIRADIELFILAHEYAHNVLNHHNDIVLTKGAFGTEKELLKYYKRSQNAEFEADGWAAMLLESIFSKDLHGSLMIHSAPSMFFSIISFLEIVSENFFPLKELTLNKKIFNNSSKSTHPPSWERRDAVEQILFKYIPEENIHYQSFVKNLFNALSEQLLSKLPHGDLV